jgi:hypothetical protein
MLFSCSPVSRTLNSRQIQRTTWGGAGSPKNGIIEIMRSRSSKDHDFTTVAKRVVEQAIGEQWDGSPLPDPNAGKNPAAVALGKLGGAKGGRARAEALSPAKRSRIAKRAAKARWI